MKGIVQVEVFSKKKVSERNSGAKRKRIARSVKEEELYRVNWRARKGRDENNIK